MALVTGSYRGTGAGIARSLAGEGAVVLVHGLEPGQADEVVSDIAAGGGRAHVVVGDIRTEDGTAAMVDDVRAQLVAGGRDHVDIVVNNFGNTDHASDWDAADTATWHGSYDINVVSAVPRHAGVRSRHARRGVGTGRGDVDDRRDPTR